MRRLRRSWVLGRTGRLRCHRQRADLVVATLPWVPVGAARALTVVGVGRTCAEAQAFAFGMVGLLATTSAPGLN